MTSQDNSYYIVITFGEIGDLYVCVCVCMCLTLQPSGLWPTRLLCPWDSPDKNIGAGCYALLQGIFPTQG